MARALDQVLEEQVVGPLLRLADHELRPEQTEPKHFADIVVAERFR
jgi:hypothetical protein